MKTYYLLLIAVLVNSCREKSHVENKECNINTLTLEVPTAMKFIKGAGIDSYVAYLIDEKNDTFHVEYGRKHIINNLITSSPPVFQMSSKERVIKQLGREPSSEEVVFSDYPKEDEEEKIFDKNYYTYDTINGITTKIIQPKKIGNGITGMFIPKLNDGNSFSIYSVNLDSNSHRMAINIFKSIRYNISKK